MMLQPKHLTRRPMVMALSDADVIGDPFGGPASGSREKSKGLGMVIGVVASVMTAGAGYAMWAANTGMQALAGGAMMAGGVMSGVGAVTGNQKLAKIGGIMSLAGGIGSGLADMGAGGSFGDTLSKASSKFGSDFGSAFKDVTGMGKAAGEAANASTLGLEASSITGGDAVASAVADPSVGVTTLGDNAASASQMVGGSRVPATLSLEGTSLANAGPTSSGGGLLGQAGSSGASGNGSVIYQIGGKEPAANFLDSPMKWANQNQGLLSMGTKLAGAAMDESGDIDQAKVALATDQWATQKDLIAQQTANVNGGVVFLDPSSPNYATAAANAQAAGRTVKTIGVNQNAGPVQLNNGFMASSTPQQQATQRA